MTTHLVRSILLCVLTLLSSMAPVFAGEVSGQADRERDRRLVQGQAYPDLVLTLDDEDVTLGELVERDGLVLVILSEDPGSWNWKELEELAHGKGFARIAKLALYPNTQSVRFAAEDLTRLQEFLPVHVTDDEFHWVDGDPDERPTYVFFNPDTEYQGSYRRLHDIHTQSGKPIEIDEGE